MRRIESPDSGNPLATTTDIQLSAYLVLLGHKIEKTEWKGHNKAMFMFEDSEELKNLVVTFYNGDAIVEPQAYTDQIRNIKRMCAFTSQEDK